MTSSDRPQIKIPYSAFERILEVISFSATAGMFAMFFVMYASLPDQMPMHMSYDGSVTRVDNKSNLITLPIINLFLFVFLSLVVRFPQKFNFPVSTHSDNALVQYRNARRMAVAIKAIVCFFFAGSFYLVLSNPVGVGDKVPYAGFGILALLVLVFGTSSYFVAQSYKISKT